jgi:hypothetical protein
VSFLYTLNLFDPTDRSCDGVDTRTFTSLEQAETLVQLLGSQCPGINPRFERLLVLAHRDFPGKVQAFSGRNGDAVRVAGQPQKLEGEGKTGALLTVAVDSNDLSAVMPELLRWSRELGLDVFDEVRRVFLPWRGKPVPAEVGMAYAQASGWGRPLRVWSSALELRQVVIDRLTRRLSFHGWQFQTEPGFDAVFLRPVSDGYQRITARLKGDLPALSCDIVIEQGMRWFTQAMRQAGYPLGNPSAVNKIFQFDLADFRLLHSPGWLRWIDTGLVALTWSEGWLDWLLDDLESQAIPVLNKAQTMDGLYGLFLDPANAGTFPANVPQIGAADPACFEAVLAVAFACEHRGLDALISRFDTQLKSQGSEASRVAMQRLVRALRELPRPVPVSSANE